MSRYHPYLNYKASGVEWLGEVPEHWEVTSLKHVSKITLGKMLTPNNKGGMHLKPYLRAKNIQWINTQADDINEMWFSPDEMKVLRLQKDDILVSEGGEVGRACIWQTEIEECYIQNSVNRVRMREGHPKFYLYQFYAAGKFGYFDAIVNKISIAHLTKEKLGDAKFVEASLPEQTAIADFLDRETVKIDTLIAKQQRLIALLKEKRQAVISHAVTKGLDPDAKMKKSGVEWLGEVPEHWEIVQSRRLFSQRKERAREGDEQLTASQKYGIVSQKEFMELEGRRVVQVITGNEILKHIEPDDFVISMRSFQGGLEWCKQAGSVSSAYIGLIPIKHVVPRFFAYLFKCKPYIQALQSTSNLVRDGQALRFENFSLVDLIIVPNDEQVKIADYLDRETAKIDTLIEKAEKAIALLQERRTALISAAVTGKIDVRESA